MESRFGILDGYLRTWAQLVTKFQIHIDVHEHDILFVVLHSPKNL